MTIDSDDIVSLPSPPPPRPAARRAAIDAALRKFDGVEEAPTGGGARRRPSLAQWASSHRRPVGALVTAALVAVISIPVIEIALRDHPKVASEDRQPSPVQRDVDVVEDSAAFEEPAADQANPNEPASASRSHPAAPAVTENRSEFVAAQRQEKAGLVTPAQPAMAPVPPPMVAASPPPPPPPAPAMEAEDSAVGSIVVTGSRARRQNLESSSPVTIIDPSGEFLSQLQAGLEANDRRAVIRLVGFPLRVTWNGDTRIYRTAKDVERDYDRIFSPEVRLSLVNQRPDTLTRRDKGRLIGNGRIWFGCGLRSCSSDATIRIREVAP